MIYESLESHDLKILLEGKELDKVKPAKQKLFSSLEDMMEEEKEEKAKEEEEAKINESALAAEKSKEENLEQDKKDETI